MMPLALEHRFPPAGPCEICGGPDKRHRLWDSIIGAHEVGVLVRQIAEDYGLRASAVAAILTVARAFP